MNPSSPRYKADFPKPIHYAGSSAVGWLADEIDAWIARQVQSSREADPS